jgi:aerotolerance regulator-like protein/VWA domain-containing protein
MLSFLSPLFLLGALAAAIPVVLHLLKREPEPRVKFAAVKLLKHAPVESTERRRIRELLLLAMRVAALVLLALAFAQPFLASGAARASAGVTMVALDTSYSMSAPGAFERAKQLARAAVERVPSGDLVGVVTFSDLPALVARPAPDRAFALSAIAAAAVGFGATRYRGALGAAVQALGGRRGTIVVVTDLQETGWDAGDRVSIPESVRVEIADVGPPPPDLAVTALRAEGEGFVASVRNSGDRPRSTRARLTLDGRAAAEAAATIGPRAAVEVEFAGTSKSRTPSTAAVAIDDPGGIPADDVRYAVLGGANRRSIAIVTSTGDLAREAFYVQQALSASTSAGDGFQLVGVSPPQLSTWDAAQLAPHAAVLLLSTRGLERRGREALAAYAKAGGGLLMAVGPDIDGDVVGDVLGAEARLRIATGNGKPQDRALAPADLRHPIFRSFGGAATLGLVTFHIVAQIDGTGCQGVARFTTGEIALLECMPGEGRALVLASDFGNHWNDFPLHATFVPFLHEAVGYLASGRAQSDYLVSDVPAGIPAVPGIAVMPAPGPQSRTVAVNVDPRESDPTRVSVAEFQAAVTRLKDVGTADAQVEARQQEDRQHLWQYALALMMATLAIEGVVASRTA